MTGTGKPSISQPPRLGALEAQVMEILWDQGACTIREVINQLSSEPAYTTIATVLGNLERKFLVSHQRAGRSVRYTPRITREQHAASLMEHALDNSRDRAASILHFVESMPEGDLELLRQYLNTREDPETS